jgi:hypothetical protein
MRMFSILRVVVLAAQRRDKARFHLAGARRFRHHGQRADAGAIGYLHRDACLFQRRPAKTRLRVIFVRSGRKVTDLDDAQQARIAAHAGLPSALGRAGQPRANRLTKPASWATDWANALDLPGFLSYP